MSSTISWLEISRTRSQGTVSGGNPKDRDTTTCVTSGSLPVSTIARSLKRPICFFFTKTRRPRISLRKNSCSMTVAMTLPPRPNEDKLVDHQRHQSQQVPPEHHQRESNRSGHLDARLAIPGIDRGEFAEEIAKFAHAGFSPIGTGWEPAQKTRTGATG